MKITAVEEYGLRCALRLAMEARGGPLTVGEIATREGLTVPHVAKLMSLLRDAGLVESVRGRSGGYSLTRPASQISVEEALGALGEPLFSTAYCENHPGTLDVCTHSQGCAIRSVWQVLGETIQSVLRNTSLADLCLQESVIARQLAEGRGSGLLELVPVSGTTRAAAQASPCEPTAGSGAVTSEIASSGAGESEFARRSE